MENKFSNLSKNQKKLLAVLLSISIVIVVVLLFSSLNQFLKENLKYLPNFNR